MALSCRRLLPVLHGANSTDEDVIEVSPVGSLAFFDLMM